MTQITLTGLEFSPQFLAALPEFERSLVSHDYNAADFSMHKVKHPDGPGSYAHLSMTQLFDYTTQVHNESFLTTFSDDMQFLHYLAKLCFAPDEPHRDQSDAGIIPHIGVIEKISRLFHRAEHWLTDTPYKGN